MGSQPTRARWSCALGLLLGTGGLTGCDQAAGGCRDTAVASAGATVADTGAPGAPDTTTHTDTGSPDDGDTTGEPAPTQGTTGEPPPAADEGDTTDGGTAEPAAPTLRVMSFNIRHGAESSLEEVAAAIRAEAPDIVALQEVDKEAERSDLVFQSYRLGQLTGMASLFRNALVFPEGGEYGLAILTRFPIPSSQKVSLTSTGEQRVLVVVDVEVDDGLLVPIAITHMGLDAAEREQQAAEIVAALDGRPWAILMGDFNAEPDSAAFGLLDAAFVDAWPLAGLGDGFTIPVGVPNRRIDYVMLDESWAPPVEAHVPATQTSDHRPVVVTLPWPK